MESSRRLIRSMRRGAGSGSFIIAACDGQPFSLPRFFYADVMGARAHLESGHRHRISPCRTRNRKVALRDFRGQTVVLNFWATWCPPCVEEMPSLVQLDQRMGNKGIKIVGVSVDVDSDAYHKFLKDYKVDFLTVRDPGTRRAPAFTAPSSFPRPISSIATGWCAASSLARWTGVRRKLSIF